MECKKESSSLVGPVVICDWGSSNLRVYLVGEDGEVRRRYESQAGAKALAGAASAYCEELRKALGELEVGDESEIRISGMAGSKLGWRETPYLATPMAMEDFVLNFSFLEEFPGARLFGGLKHENEDGSLDVMRGEEVQIFGGMELCPEARLICLPGTHSKWVKVEGGKILSFRTVMTGDLFQALCEKSIFKEQITSGEFHREGFLAGCALAKSGSDLQDLFKLRSAFVFSKVSSEEFHSYLSGFLIANEIRSAGKGETRVHLCGAASLVSMYALAMKEMGMDSSVIDGETATIRGHLSLFSL